MPSALRARDARTAAHSAVLIVAVCAVALAGLTAAQSAPLDVAVLSWVGVTLLLAAARAWGYAPAELLDRRGVCVAPRPGGVLLATTLTFLAAGAPITGQSALAFPVLWAASHLRRGA